MNVITTYDAGDDILAKNKIKTALLYTTTGTGDVISLNHELLFSNK